MVILGLMGIPIGAEGEVAVAPITQGYIKGYAQAVLTREYGLPADALSVKDGVIYLSVKRLPAARFAQIQDKVIRSLQGIEGVKDVVLHNGVEAHYPPGLAPMAVEKEEPQSRLPDGFLVPHTIFKPLFADPKWARFAVAYQYWDQNKLGKHVFAPTFGATFSLYRHNMDAGQLEIGIQAGLFAIMDIGRDPTALLNADYVIGLPVAYRSGPWSNLTRFYHMSSHLGDEFMLTPEGKRLTRVNLSYEVLDNIVSYEFTNGLRLYGGGGYIVHREPSSLKPVRLQGGIEYRHPTTTWNNQLRPVVGLDLKSNQESRWEPDLSVKAGVQVQNSRLTDREVLFLVEWYKGHSMHGQFYKRRLNYVGVGVQVFL